MKLWNRIKYGKSATPRYIEKRALWLYNNEWYDLPHMVSAYAGAHYTAPASCYIYSQNGRKYTTDDLNILVQALIGNPTTSIELLQPATPTAYALITAIGRTTVARVMAEYDAACAELSASLNKLDAQFKSVK